jgi:hypothetical protein
MERNGAPQQENEGHWKSPSLKMKFPQRRICPSTNKPTGRKNNGPETKTHAYFTLYPLTISRIRPFDYSLKIYT